MLDTGCWIPNQDDRWHRGWMGKALLGILAIAIERLLWKPFLNRNVAS